MSDKANGTEPIILIGAGGHARSSIDVIESNGNYQILGLIGQDKEIGQEICGYPVLGTEKILTQLRNKVQAIALGLGQIKTSNLRERYFHLARELGFHLPVIASSSARVSKHATIGIGTIIFHGATINASAKVGMCNIVNSHALIEHNVRIGDFCHISTGTIINGSVDIGDRSFIGSRSIIVNDVVVANDTFVKAGSIVKRDV